MTKLQRTSRSHKQLPDIRAVRENTCLARPVAEHLIQNVSASRQRSKLLFNSKTVTAAPVVSIRTDSSLLSSVRHCLSDLHDISEQTNMVLAVADAGSSIIWSRASRSMRRAAEQVNFTAGGQWSEASVGTNALALSAQTGLSSCVISDEHMMETVHDWVCYAAPIRDPFSQKVLGVVDLSTKLTRHNSLGIIAAEHCARIIRQSLLELKKHSLYIHSSRHPKICFNGKTLAVTPRQLEILMILSLYPAGLTLEQLHQALYGNRAVTTGTLKTELSKLRRLLNGMLGSRPYRLLVDVDADFLKCEALLHSGYRDAAWHYAEEIFHYQTDSPFLNNWRQQLQLKLELLHPAIK